MSEEIILLIVVALFPHVAAFIPNKSSNPFVQHFLNVVNKGAGNYGTSRNADDA